MFEYGDHFHDVIKKKIKNITKAVLGGDKTDLPLLKRLLCLFWECHIPETEVDQIKKFSEEIVGKLKAAKVEDVAWLEDIVEKIGQGAEKFHRVILEKMTHIDYSEMIADEARLQSGEKADGKHKRLFWLSLDILSDAHLPSRKLKEEVKTGLKNLQTFVSDKMPDVRGFLDEVVLKIQASEG